jgi:hypothetical protein
MLTVSVSISLGALLRRQGNYGEARRYLEEALLHWERAGEKRDVELVTLLHELAAVYLAQEAPAEARICAKRSLHICRDRFGAEHHLTARSVSILDTAASRQERTTSRESDSSSPNRDNPCSEKTGYTVSRSLFKEP